MTLEEATKNLESRLQRVHMPDPVSHVSLEIVSRLKSYPPEADETIPSITVPFVVISSGDDVEGNRIMHETAEEAVSAWVSSTEQYLEKHANASTLFWRTKPMLENASDFTRRKSGWKVYSRLAVL